MSLGSNMMNMLVEKAHRKRFPITVNLELLPVCNLNCKMCYIRVSWEEMKQQGRLKTVEEWLGLAKQLKEAGTLFLLLTGGEVFIYPEFKKLYVELYKMGFAITINTNATLIDEETVEWLRKYPPKCVSISLYGSSDATYEKLCGRKGMFSKVRTAIDLLLKYNIWIECKTVLTPLNYNDLEQCWQFCEMRNISYLMTTYSFPPLNTKKSKEFLRFSPEEAAQMMMKSNLTMYGKAACDEQIKKRLVKYTETKMNEGETHRGFTCSACNSSCWINWQGKMFPCAMMNNLYSLPFEIGFLKAWEELKVEVDRIISSKKCSHCENREICSVCPAAIYAETGSFDECSEYHCRMTSQLLNLMVQQVEVEKV